MSYAPAIVGYVPPPSFGCAQKFLENILKFKTKHRLILISDHPYEIGERRILPPEGILPRDTHNPHPLIDPYTRMPKPCAINNAIFHTCLRIAIQEGVSHMLYVESDCRVNGDHWDERVFDEFFSQPFPVIAAGTLVTWNIFNGGLKFVSKWEQLVHKTSFCSFPMSNYGSMPHGNNPCNPAIFPNGALGVYSLEWMAQLFDLSSMLSLATDRAWDFVLGSRLVERFNVDAFEMVAHLNSVLSVYGDTLCTEDQRLKWLSDKRWAAVHQVKSKRGL